MTTDFPIPERIAKYWTSLNNVTLSFNLSNGFLKLCKPIYYEFDNVVYEYGTANFLPKVNGVDRNNYSFVIEKNQTWSGTRVLDRNTRITGNNESVSIIQDNKVIYSGTLMDPMQPVYQSLKSYKDLKYKNGILNLNNRTVKYINGESEDAIKNRLQNQSIEDDIIAQVIAGDISEADALVKQQQRDEEKERQLKAENEKLAEIIRSKWNCNDIAFSGPFKGTTDGDAVFRMLFNLDHTYFDGEVLMALQSDGQAEFAIVAQPSQKANRLSRPKAMQLLGACEKLNKTVNGRWSLDGNDVLINGEKVATLSKDNKTATYEGMIGSTMKIIKKM